MGEPTSMRGSGYGTLKISRPIYYLKLSSAIKSERVKADGLWSMLWWMNRKLILSKWREVFWRKFCNLFCKVELVFSATKYAVYFYNDQITHKIASRFHVHMTAPIYCQGDSQKNGIVKKLSMVIISFRQTKTYIR